MKQRLNVRLWIPVLMTVSGLLLTAFVTQWLVTQYRSLDTTIQKNVKTDMLKSGDQLLDSLVSQFIGKDFSTATIENLNEPIDEQKNQTPGKLITSRIGNSY